MQAFGKGRGVTVSTVSVPGNRSLAIFRGAYCLAAISDTAPGPTTSRTAIHSFALGYPFYRQTRSSSLFSGQPNTPARKFTQPTHPSIPARMASTNSTETPEWSAQRVRDTFLDYFKERDHTFGEPEILCNLI